MASKTFKANDNKNVGSDDNRANKTIINLSKNNKTQKLTYMSSIKVTKEYTFLIFNTKKIFNHLKQAFIKALIL